MGKPEENSAHIDTLISACIRNDRKAQISLYNLYAKRMFNTSLRIVRDMMLAEDIVQESYIKAFKSLSSFRKEVPFVIWLQRIVINKSLDELRKKKEVLSFDEQNLPDFPDHDEEYEGTEFDDAMITRVKQAMNDLPDGYRVIFSLFYFEGYDHDEIARILNINASTSRSQLTRAKQKITEKIKVAEKRYE